MNTRQLVDKVIEDKSFIFKDTAKTPYNSANSRLNTYIKNAGDNSVVEIVSRGCFIYKNS
jgi:hypothetical protein